MVVPAECAIGVTDEDVIFFAGHSRPISKMLLDPYHLTAARSGNRTPYRHDEIEREGRVTAVPPRAVVSLNKFPSDSNLIGKHIPFVIEHIRWKNAGRFAETQHDNEEESQRPVTDMHAQS
ncbi:MAG TPA: hypothetical protein VN927_01140 [Gemmatimonadaceae bacterium]|nr:hypothetical protein [Gemmatimonadaceae bacterium]